MILNWTSSVNKDTIPTGSLTAEQQISTYTYEDVMKHHIWNLYANLTSSGWTSVSASSYLLGSDEYTVTANHWADSSSIKFPSSMCQETEQQILSNEDKTNFHYTPTEHSWVTLKRSFDEGDYYFTIDCRYPLPPHKSNTSVIIERDNLNGTFTSKSHKQTEQLFVGPSSIFYDKGLTCKKQTDADADLEDDSNGEAFLNKQHINIYDGICFQDNSTNIFSMNLNDIIKGQDYISRCVSFVDIVVHFTDTRDSSVVNYADGSGEYESATTKVRPKNKTDDKKAWYVCWGFDYLDLKSAVQGNNLLDYADISKYKYAFHVTQDKEFIYQIYTSKQTDTSFRSGFGFFPVKNKQSYDKVGHTTFCINCNPGNSYSDKTINFNSVGNVINVITSSGAIMFENALSSYVPSNNQINNFFNTCYRNYNFSDGKKNIRAGDGNYIGKVGNLPIYAPIKPVAAHIFADNKSFISSSFSSIGESLKVVMPGVDSTYVGGPMTDKILLTTNNYFDNPNLYYYNINGGYKYLIKSDLLDAVPYPVYFIDGGTKKVVINSANAATYKSIKDIASPPAPGGRENLAPLTLDRGSITGFYITLPSQGDKSPPIDLSDYLDDRNFSDPDNKKIRIYVGSLPRYMTVAQSKKAILTANYQIPTSVLSAIRTVRGDSNLSNAGTNWGDYVGWTNGTITTSKAGGVQFLSAVDCYIDVPVRALFNLCEAANGNITTQNGNFNDGYDQYAQPQTQEKGVNFFSVFKACNVSGQEPLVISTYSFNKHDNSLGDKSIFGSSNFDSSKDDSRFITKKDSNGYYPELPIFLFSLDPNSAKFKGYVPDITLAPNDLDDGIVVKNSSGTGYKKVSWGGVWFPWIASEPPSFNS